LNDLSQRNKMLPGSNVSQPADSARDMIYDRRIAELLVEKAKPVSAFDCGGVAVTKAVPSTFLTDEELAQFASIKLEEASSVNDGPERDRVLAEAKALQRLAALRRSLGPRSSDASS
jgi:hypothetical protein